MSCRSLALCTVEAGLHASPGAALSCLRPPRARDQRRGLRRRATIPCGPRDGTVVAAGHVQHQGAPRGERVLTAGKRSWARSGVQRGASGLPTPSGERNERGVWAALLTPMGDSFDLSAAVTSRSMIRLRRVTRLLWMVRVVRRVCWDRSFAAAKNEAVSSVLGADTRDHAPWGLMLVMCDAMFSLSKICCAIFVRLNDRTVFWRVKGESVRCRLYRKSALDFAMVRAGHAETREVREVLAWASQ